MKKQQGTLALSWVNLAEFAKITDRQQIQVVAQFVDAISPQWCFIAVDPWAVIQSEDEILQGLRPRSEWGQLELGEVDDDIAIGVEHGFGPGRHDAGGIILLDDTWPFPWRGEIATL